MLLHAHSGLRWVVLALLLVAIVNGFRKMKSGSFSKTDKMIAVMALAFTHVQIVLGFIIYFIDERYLGFKDMSNALARLYALEHPLTMLIGAVLITIGYSKSKRKTADSAKFKCISYWYLIGLFLILIRIPWPFLVDTAKWF